MPSIWTAPTVERPEPDLIAGERRLLDQYLDYHRATLLWKCSGLTAEQLKSRPVQSSRLSLLGLVRHITEVERWWFRMYADQEQGLTFPYDPDAVGLDFEEVDPVDAKANVAAYLAECDASRAALARHALDEVVPARRDRPARSIRWIYMHMIEEYARHNGHADLIREAIDGATGE